MKPMRMIKRPSAERAGAETKVSGGGVRAGTVLAGAGIVGGIGRLSGSERGSGTGVDRGEMLLQRLRARKAAAKEVLKEVKIIKAPEHPPKEEVAPPPEEIPVETETKAESETKPMELDFGEKSMQAKTGKKRRKGQKRGSEVSEGERLEMQAAVDEAAEA